MEALSPLLKWILVLECKDSIFHEICRLVSCVVVVVVGVVVVVVVVGRGLKGFTLARKKFQTFLEVPDFASSGSVAMSNFLLCCVCPNVVLWTLLVALL